MHDASSETDPENQSARIRQLEAQVAEMAETIRTLKTTVDPLTSSRASFKQQPPRKASDDAKNLLRHFFGIR